jgi:methylenetetrahydrofolate dehydrogenase (NADP+)/methenyltetrahydrofolate cyclohydrolase
MSTILDGKKLALSIRKKISQEVKRKRMRPGLALVLIGNDPASEIYVRYKKTACEEVGIESFIFCLAANTKKDDLLRLITKLNKEKRVNGILVQLPLPKKLNKDEILAMIDPDKDVDGLNPINIGLLSSASLGLHPCTPAGIMHILKHYQIEPEGKHAVIVGRSNIVGKPLAQMLLASGATVTICHSKTKDLGKLTKQADILVAATGQAKLIKKGMVKKGAVVIDVGINRNEKNQIYGDVDFEKVSPLCSAITPVPGGVGPMTIAMLMNNCLLAYKKQELLRSKKKS